MSVKTTKEDIERGNIVDDVSSEEVKTQDAQDDEIMARLKAKKARKEAAKEAAQENTKDVENARDAQGEGVPPKIVEEKTRSISIGVIGSGQAGSRIAETFYSLGYDTVVVNTAPQDLKFIKVPESSKLLLDHGLGGAAKDLEIGHSAAETHRDAINEIVNEKLSHNQMLLFCTSLGGGSGAGSAEVIVDILSAMECPVVVVTVLPQSSDDAQTKHNALVTLSKFTKMAQNRVIDNLIVVDNARIESIYADVSQLSFFGISNKAIVDPINAFNSLSAQPSAVKGLDSTEFGKLFTDGQGLTTYGCMDVPNYEDEDALADAIIDNLDGALLAGGFNLKQTRYAGIIFAAPQRVWDKIPQSSTNYAMSMVNDACGTPLGVFKGIYTIESNEDVVKVYSMFSGLGLPQERVDQLQKEAKERMAQAEAKDENRSLSLNLDDGEEDISEAERIKKRIKAKKTSKAGFGKLHKKAIDRRK